MKKIYKILFSLLLVVCFGILACLFFSLEGQNSGIPHMQSIADAIWYSVAAFLSVSYSDIIILSFWGKLVGLSFILFGIGFLGFIIGGATNIITKHFEKRKLGHMGTHFKNHIIIIGWDSFAREVAVQLTKAERRLAVLTDSRDDIDTIYQKFGKREMFVCFADDEAPESLDLVAAKDASAIFLNRGSDTNKLVSIINIKRVYPDTHLIVLLENPKLKATFVSAGVTYVLSKDEIASRLLASYIFEPAVADYASDLIASAGHDNSAEYDIQQYRVCKSNPYLDRKYGELFKDLKEKHNIVAIGLNKAGEAGSTLMKLPDDDVAISLGDDIIVIANGVTEGVLQDLFKVCEGI